MLKNEQQSFVRHLVQVHFNRDATTSCIGKHERDDPGRNWVVLFQEARGPEGWSRPNYAPPIRTDRTKSEKHLYLDRVQLRFSEIQSACWESEYLGENLWRKVSRSWQMLHGHEHVFGVKGLSPYRFFAEASIARSIAFWIIGQWGGISSKHVVILRWHRVIRII